ncbi:MAG: cupin domain-containing protein [Candidatus Lokiarchaeota archaeon]|nr:cupin domain-containing protein [Candidatus Lokiarchaeota archaeon]
MKVIKTGDCEPAQTPHQGTIKKVIDYEHATIVHIELKPGEALKKHVTPVDVCFYILEGEGHVEIGKEDAVVAEDQLVFSPARVAHRLYNSGNATFRFLVIKTPTPTTPTSFL